jgi:hypothetical protein
MDISNEQSSIQAKLPLSQVVPMALLWIFLSLLIILKELPNYRALTTLLKMNYPAASYGELTRRRLKENERSFPSFSNKICPGLL